MFLGLLCTLVLIGALLVVRSKADTRLAATGAWSCPHRPAEVALGAGALLLAASPLLMIAPWAQGPPISFWGDTASHARVAAEIARSGLPHGWIDAYYGGFPFGHHYPQLGWLLLALLIRAGLSPAAAIHLLGWCATLSAPLVLYFASVRCGARPRHALVGGLLLLCVSPYNGFVGGNATFFQLGLLSQSLALVCCIWLAATVAASRARWPGALAAVLAMASHPQVAVATLTLAGVAAVVSGSRAAVLRCLRIGVVTVIAGSALYIQGVATLDIPFGWPPGLGWRQIGFHPSRLHWWLVDADLLDRGRVSVFTALTVAALFTLLWRLGRPVARASACTLVAALLLSVSGRTLLGMGALGSGLLAFLQPLRIVSLVPPIAAATVVVALEEATPLVAAALTRLGRTRAAGLLSPGMAVAAVAVAVFALPSWVHHIDRVGSALQALQARCGGEQLAAHGYHRDVVRGWLSGLADGRLWYDIYSDTPLRRCLKYDGADLASAVPIASTAGAGSHLGLHWLASQQLQPERPGSDRRAESLGVRYLLRQDDGAKLSGWTRRHQQGSVQLLEHAGRPQLVSAGCIKQRWRGDPKLLRHRLQSELGTPVGADALLDPQQLTALDYTTGGFELASLRDDDCDAANASVEVLPGEPGAVEATVQSSAPVDVVFRFTAFPTWKVSIDGRGGHAPQLVAPGFFAVRVPAGHHRVVAEVSLMPGYGWLLTGAALAIVALTCLRFGHLQIARKLLKRAFLPDPR